MLKRKDNLKKGLLLNFDIDFQTLPRFLQEQLKLLQKLSDLIFVNLQNRFSPAKLMSLIPVSVFFVLNKFLFADIFHKKYLLDWNFETIKLFNAQKVKFTIKDISSTCEQICRKLRIWSHLLKISLMENFIFCGVFYLVLSSLCEGQVKEQFFFLDVKRKNSFIKEDMKLKSMG